MDPIQILLYGLALVAAALAWAVARGRPLHRPIAWLLTFQIVTDLMRLPLRELVIMPRLAADPSPLTGWFRVAFHVSQAMFVGWRVGIVALSLWVFGKRKPWLVVAAYVAVELVLILGYPTLRGDLLQRVYLGVELACLCASLGFIIRWYFGREPWSPETIITGLIVTLEASMVTAGPYRVSIWTGWDRAWSILLVNYILVIIIEGWLWAFTPKRSW